MEQAKEVMDKLLCFLGSSVTNKRRILLAEAIGQVNFLPILTFKTDQKSGSLRYGFPLRRRVPKKYAQLSVETFESFDGMARRAADGEQTNKSSDERR